MRAICWHRSYTRIDRTQGFLRKQTQTLSPNQTNTRVSTPSSANASASDGSRNNTTAPGLEYVSAQHHSAQYANTGPAAALGGTRELARAGRDEEHLELEEPYWLEPLGRRTAQVAIIALSAIIAGQAAARLVGMLLT